MVSHWCLAHRLELIFKTPMKSFAFDNLQKKANEFYSFFSRSSKRTTNLDEYLSREGNRRFRLQQSLEVRYEKWMTDYLMMFFIFCFIHYYIYPNTHHFRNMAAFYFYFLLVVVFGSDILLVHFIGEHPLFFQAIGEANEEIDDEEFFRRMASRRRRRRRERREIRRLERLRLLFEE